MASTDGLETYDGFETEQAFVKCDDDRLWRYCVNRHAGRWVGKRRRVPSGFHHEGKAGWWFPASWLQGFHELHGTQLKSAGKTTHADITRVTGMLKTQRENYDG